MRSKEKTSALFSAALSKTVWWCFQKFVNKASKNSEIELQKIQRINFKNQENKLLQIRN